jgi:drug/metabolite transporter (DMT)-like permease
LHYSLLEYFYILKNLLNFKVIFSSRQLPIRGLFESFAAICFFVGVAMLPFGMVYVLLSLAPIFLTTFGALFLNEKVRWRRWTAVIFGFIGVVVVINPTKLEFGFYFYISFAIRNSFVI